ncbi:MAG: pyruvate:ferredoxin (flavodoxin) oxidoreductase, partial [Bacteroidetes bacterium]|nr:pyruvate:ferredoxin (flavodoxin) oxidoreductase [Bacteroidota bacterium]
IAMGSITETLKEVVDHLNEKGEKVGLLSVHLYRPFSAKYFMDVLPRSVKRISVLDRTKELGANGEPLYLDIKNLFYGKENAPLVVGGRYGLSSKDTTPAMMISVFDNLKMNEPKDGFTVGIVDDVTFTSLPLLPEISLSEAGTFEGKFYGLGSDGTVGANKNSIMIIGESTDKYCQAYFAYDSKKSGGITTSHLRFGDNPIRSPYLVGTPDFVACHVSSYLEKYDMLKGIKDGGTFLLNSIWSPEETHKHLPNLVKKQMADHKINFYIINATKLAQDIGLGNRTNTIMQSAFFKIADIIPYKQAVEEMRKFIIKSFGRKGEEVVNMNFAAVEKGGAVIKVEVDAAWSKLGADAEKVDGRDIPDFVRNVVEPINNLAGDDLPVSAFAGREDGTFPAGTAQYEKRGIAVNVPEWIDDNCIQCNQCAYVCPHAAIRPFLIDEDEARALPEGTKTIDANGKAFAGLQFKIQVSVLDCTGCGNCADVCPSKVKSLEMKPLETQEAEISRWDHLIKEISYKDTLVDKKQTVKNSQFSQPLFEFSGACAGCGETPYIKLITQLYGDQMIVANATGCSSIYGGSAPSTPYCANVNGQGPAWANSLFEDNAEYGFGLATGVNKNRDRMKNRMVAAMDEVKPVTKEAIGEWIATMENLDASKAASAKLLEVLDNETHAIAEEIKGLKQYLVKKSVWIFGGDGWAYDIGFGGLDHVIASGEDVNILVMDTEVYSNTGGQASKATPVGAVAKFAASGKKIRKKDLGMMAMTYGYVYVAQVSMGASQSQYLKAVREAEAYPGPSIIIAYSPCISHGLRAGMGKTQAQGKFAVESGYWHLYRYNPVLEEEGKNPFLLDSKEPQWDQFQGFLQSEVRYTSLQKSFPAEAEVLFKAAQTNAKWRYNSYVRMASLDFSPKV